jgi:hypothetical protein
MIATNRIRPARIAIPLLLTFAFAACQPREDGPAAPETAAPAPPPAASTAEDRGRPATDGTAKPGDEQSAFSHVESGEAERAASQRGHASAGEASPATPPGSGG